MCVTSCTHRSLLRALGTRWVAWFISGVPSQVAGSQDNPHFVLQLEVPHSMKPVSMISLLPVALLAASACGSGEGSSSGDVVPAAASAAVRVDPVSTLAKRGGTVVFRATVTGVASPSVKWTAECGSISETGVYTAPQNDGVCRVTATSAVAAASSSALVNVGEGGWAEKCGAEPEPTANVVYACDCQQGADGDCKAGDDANPGTKALPLRTWSKVADAWRALPAGGTVALCKGGSLLGSHQWIDRWVNRACTPNTPCTMRDYTAPWASGDESKPIVLSTGSDETLVTIYGHPTGAAISGGYRFLNLRFYRPDGGATPAAKGAQAFRGIGKAPHVEVCNCDIDGFGGAFYVSDFEGGPTICGTSDWRIRGNRITNICSQGMLMSLKDSDIDGNYFDNVGHSLCGGYDLSQPSGGTTHTIYLDGRACPNNNVRVINNEVHRNSFYGGAPIGSAFVMSAGASDILFENNLIDMTPVHPSRAGGAIFGGNEGSGNHPGPLKNIVVRRNRILAGRGRQIGISQVTGLIEDNVIIVSTPSTEIGHDIVAFPHTGNVTNGATSVVVRNNTFYIGGAADSYLVAIRVAYDSATTGNIVTGNSVTFAGGGGTCFRADDPSRLAFMDNNQCSGAANYAMGANSTPYSLAGWRAATAFDPNSIVPGIAGLFVNAPTDLTPATTSPLVDAASTSSSCTVLGVANQPCSSLGAMGSPMWSPLDSGGARGGTPSIGAFER